MYPYQPHVRYNPVLFTTNLSPPMIWYPPHGNQPCWVNHREYAPVYYHTVYVAPTRKPDNMMPRHNTKHRNSTSSDAAASDDLNSSSSNDDLSAAYAVISQADKKPTKSRQRRQQRRKQQTNNTNANSSNEHSNSNSNRNPTPMDIDEESKENRPPMRGNGNGGKSCMPPSGNAVIGNVGKAASGMNLRKQCTKAAALKAANSKGAISKGAISKCTTANTLTTSASNSSVCSSLSSASSTLSISSSVSSSASSSPTNSAHCSPTASPTVSKRSIGYIKKAARVLAIATATPLPRPARIKLSIPEYELAQHMRRYLIDPNLLRVYGYPVESAIHEGCIEIYKCLPRAFVENQPPPPPPPPHHHHHHHTHHNQHERRNNNDAANVINEDDGLAIDFHADGASGNKWAYDAHNSGGDSGQGSGESSPPSVDSDSSEVGEDEAAAVYVPDGPYQFFSEYDQTLEKQCSRCNRMFHVTESGEYLSYEPCTFHWGKITHVFTQGIGYNYRYTCCRDELSSAGCSRNSLHVWTGSVVGLNGPYTDFVHTRTRHPSSRNRSAKVFALDCEMSFTGRGLEVTKVTVVGHDGELAYEHFVRPPAEIVDYNTRFSGVTARDLHGRSSGSVKTLQEVQHDLLQMFDADTILIGHGLDNDLRVLRIVHKTVIDTSITFPHASGFPYRRALKNLARSCLSREIQQSEDGHSSFEDSRTCLELMLWKVQTEILDELQH